MTIWGGCSLNYGLRGSRKKYEKEAKEGKEGKEEDMGRKWKQTDSFNEETPLASYVCCPRFYRISDFDKTTTELCLNPNTVRENQCGAEKEVETELKEVSVNADHQ